MAIRTSTQSGNTNSTPFAFGSAVNAGDQLQVTADAHAITFDASIAIGISLCTTYQTKTSGSATGTGGSLPAGAYAFRIAAVGSTGTTTPSSFGFGVTITAGQKVRIVLPTLPAGASSWTIYLTDAGGSVARRYATGQAAGNFDCTSASWENGTVAYAAAALPAFGDAFGYADAVTTHSGGITIATGVTVTCKGDLTFLGNLTENAGSIIEFDAAASPSAAAIYRLYFGAVLAAGAPKLIQRGSSGSRAEVRSKTATTAAHVVGAEQFATSSDVKLDLQWGRFRKLGDATYRALTVAVASVYTHQLSDVVFDADCYTVDFQGATVDGGWNLVRVAFRQTSGQTISGRPVCVAFQPGTDKTTGTRLVDTCSFSSLPVGFGRGGSEYRNCFLYDGWALISDGPGGSGTSDFNLNNAFVRLNPAGAGTGIDTQTLEGQSDGGYLYIDNISGPTAADFNPHGFTAGAKGVGTTRVHNGWTMEYNMDSGEGDMFKNALGVGTVRLTNNLLMPNRIGAPSGTMLTSPDGAPTGYFAEIEHNTYVGEQYGISMSELTHAGGVVSKFKSNLVFSIVGTETFRFAVSNIHNDPTEDAIDSLVPAGCDYNAGWNLQTASGVAGSMSWYNTKLSAAVGAHDVDLGDSAGADISLFGPKFVDPSRKFISWAVTVLGATGTDAQKITKGLDALRAIADTTDANYVPGLLMTAPATWVRAGFAPTNTALNGTAHDGGTIGAIAFVSGGGGGSGVGPKGYYRSRRRAG